MKLKAEIRTRKGKGGVRKLRTEGKVPAVIYGCGETPLLIQIEENLAKSLNKGKHLTIEIDKPIDVIIKEIQLEPTTFKPLHIDFQHLHSGEKVKTIAVSVGVPEVVEEAKEERKEE